MSVAADGIHQQENESHPRSASVSPDPNNKSGATILANNNVVKPRVSFNRDVHVKRIGSRGSSDIVPALTSVGVGLDGANNNGGITNNNSTNNEIATNGNNNTRLLAVLPVRREKLGHLSRKELAEEAAKVLRQADSVYCVSNQTGDFGPEKFYSLPSRKKNRINTSDSPNSSIERKYPRRRRSEELGVTIPNPDITPAPKKPPRTFLSQTPSTDSNTPTRPKRSKKNSFKNLFRPKNKPVKRTKSDVQSLPQKPVVKITRSRSDISDKKVRKRTNNEEAVKAPLSPIIEASPSVEASLKGDYFSVKPVEGASSSDKENRVEVKPPERKKWKQPGVDEVDNVKNLKSKFEKEIMIHSSQKPVDRLPLTRGNAVDHMVKRLSHERFSPPPKSTTILVTPNIGLQHNNNQPFSYTKSSPELDKPYYRPLSPNIGTTFEESITRTTDPEQIIYAQVVCGPETKTQKQTTHYTFTEKKFTQNSDSDEGLGYEEFRKDEDLPITPKYNFSTVLQRGRADGMDAKRRESLTDLINESFKQNDLASRRKGLESRINSRNKHFQNTLSPQKLYDRESSPNEVVEKFTSESYLNYNGDLVRNESRYKHEIGGKEFHKSNPELIAQKRYEDVLESSTARRNNHHNRYEQTSSYHDSLKRKTEGTDRARNDFQLSSTPEHHHYLPQSSPTHRNLSNSEDEGFQSSLLIATEKQHTEENQHQKKIVSEYHHQRSEHRRNIYEYNLDKENRPIKYQRETPIDSDHNSDEYRKTPDSRKSKSNGTDYVPRERSIDDGSHYDPRIDKDLEKTVDKKLATKPPKPDKKTSSLDKVKNLFTSKKTKEKRAAKAASQLMVDERVLRARYSEYKGSKEDLDSKQEVDYSKRKKLTTPRSSRSPTPTNGKEPLSARKSAPVSGSTGTLTRSKQKAQEPANNNWFKSIDRLTRKNKKPIVSEPEASETDCASSIKPQKNLRFFGDTDAESNNDSLREKSKHRPNATLTRTTSHSQRNLNDIDEHSDTDRRRVKSTKHTKPPVSPFESKSRTTYHENEHRRTPNGVRGDSTLKRLRRNDSLHESSTEGDSSQQSQRSVVYLHAATVGDIPGPGDHRTLRSRATSRDELNSLSSSRIATPQVKTLSRSFSVLAPWKPRHYREGYDIDYSHQPVRSKTATSTSVKSKIESKNSRSNGDLSNRRTRSKENISTLNRRNVSKSKEDVNKNGNTLSRTKTRDGDGSLYKKREKSSKASMSLESLGNGQRHKSSNNVSDAEKDKRIARSVSMPKEKSAGWFGKKSVKK